MRRKYTPAYPKNIKIYVLRDVKIGKAAVIESLYGINYFDLDT